MSKEYLEAFGRITLHTESDNDSSYDCLHFEDDCKLVDNALQRLESIDNAEPSEATKLLEHIICSNNLEWMPEMIRDSVKRDLETIKQALLKAQEPKNYLKWEDLEFKELGQKINVKLGDSKYTLWCRKVKLLSNLVLYEVTLIKEKTFEEIEIREKQFFNDLRLERVE